MRVVTFYSYKGGVGRTQALVNVAAALQRAGKRVLMVDFDLEAPGLDAIRGLKVERGPGLVELIHDYLSSGSVPDVDRYVRSASFVVAPEARTELRRKRVERGAVFLLPSGDRSDEAKYKRKLGSIDFGALYQQRDGFLLFEDLRCQWRDHLNIDYVLIDSRTGHTDVGGICVRQLPDHVILLFYPNEQNLQGIASVAKEARGEARAPEIDAVMSRVPFLDDYEQHLVDFASRARRELRVPRVYRVHSYDSIHLLRDEIFLANTALDQTRLSGEYRKIVRAIVSRNISDRDAVMESLEGGAMKLRAVIGRKRLNDWFMAVRSQYRGDEQALESLAIALRRNGLDDLEGEVRTDLARLQVTGPAAMAWQQAKIAEATSPDEAVRLAAKALDAGDGLAAGLRLEAFLLLCRLGSPVANQYAESVQTTAATVEWVDREWEFLSRTYGGMRVARAVYERVGLKPWFGPGAQSDGLGGDADGTMRRGPSPLESERLAIAIAAVGPSEGAILEYIDDRLCENMALKTRAIDCLPIAPYRSDAEFGAWVRHTENPHACVSLDILYEVRAPIGVRNASSLMGIRGDVEYEAVELTRNLQIGIPEDAEIAVLVRAALAQALAGDTDFAKRFLPMIRAFISDRAASPASPLWIFNCWQMLNRPAFELIRDIEAVVAFHDASEEVKEHAGERLYMRPPFL